MYTKITTDNSPPEGRIPDMEQSRPGDHCLTREQEVTFMVLHVTDKCNLRCVYCYEGNRPQKAKKMMTVRIARNAVDWLIRRSGQKKQLRIVFFGGEPLLNFPLIRETVSYSNRVSQLKGKTITYSISTNGTLLTSGIIQFFRENNIVPTISMDGTRIIQDRQRPFSDGRGSYDSLAGRIRELLRVIPQAGCNAVLLDGKNHKKVMNGVKKLGFEKIGISPPVSISPSRQEILQANIPNNDHAWFTRDLSHNSRKLLQHIKSRDIGGIHSVTQVSPLLGIMEFIVKNVNIKFPCGAGRSSVAVSTEGDIYPCHRFTGSAEFRLGNISKPDFERNFNAGRRHEEIPACHSCNARNLCAGGCPHDNYMTTGNLNVPSAISCFTMQEAFRVSEKLACSLDNSDLEFLSRQHFFFPEDCTLDFNDSRQNLRSPGRNLSRALHLD